ncbi:MAG: AAA family ATPase [Caldilineaceae bacterium]|nr:AAA family ATPase [Caldilineaceae bacterium]
MCSQSSSTNLHLPSLSIKGFRGIRDLAIKRLGHVTLIAGKNNSGKTSILEAVRLLMEGGSLGTIREILQLREENISLEEETEGVAFPASALFHGFPELDAISQPILASTCDDSRQLKMEVKWFLEEFDKEGIHRLVAEKGISEWMPDHIPALVVTAEEEEGKVYTVDRLYRLISDRSIRSYFASSQKPPLSRFINSSSTERTSTLGSLWDNISLTDKEPYILEALQIIDESISAVSVIGDPSLRNRPRRAIVRSKEFSRPVPLRSFGDGLNRLFGIILSLVNISGGVLLIDEFENGLHHTIQTEAWNLIFRLAKKLNIQILATTHSFDSVVTFARVAVAHEELDGLLVRIDQFGDQMRAVEYTEQDLQVAALQRIEVR